MNSVSVSKTLFFFLIIVIVFSLTFQSRLCLSNFKIVILLLVRSGILSKLKYCFKMGLPAHVKSLSAAVQLMSPAGAEVVV